MPRFHAHAHARFLTHAGLLGAGDGGRILARLSRLLSHRLGSLVQLLQCLVQLLFGLSLSLARFARLALSKLLGSLLAFCCACFNCGCTA